jgi:hypothetical protein
VAGQGIRTAIQEGAIYQGAGDFIKSTRRIADPGVVAGGGGDAAETVATAAGVASFPLNRVIVEIDIEIAGAGIRTIGEDDLKGVQLIGIVKNIVITDAWPGDA